MGGVRGEGTFNNALGDGQLVYLSRIIGNYSL